MSFTIVCRDVAKLQAKTTAAASRLVSYSSLSKTIITLLLPPCGWPLTHPLGKTIITLLLPPCGWPLTHPLGKTIICCCCCHLVAGPLPIHWVRPYAILLLLYSWLPTYPIGRNHNISYFIVRANLFKQSHLLCLETIIQINF